MNRFEIFTFPKIFLIFIFLVVVLNVFVPVDLIEGKLEKFVSIFLYLLLLISFYLMPEYFRSIGMKPFWGIMSWVAGILFVIAPFSIIELGTGNHFLDKILIIMCFVLGIFLIFRPIVKGFLMKQSHKR